MHFPLYIVVVSQLSNGRDDIERYSCYVFIYDAMGFHRAQPTFSGSRVPPPSNIKQLLAPNRIYNPPSQLQGFFRLYYRQDIASSLTFETLLYFSQKSELDANNAGVVLR